MATTTKPEARRLATAMRQAARAFDQLGDIGAGVPEVSTILTVADCDAAEAIHATLAEAADRVYTWGVSQQGRVHVIYAFDLEEMLRRGRVEIVLAVPLSVADEVVPAWRTAGNRELAVAG